MYLVHKNMTDVCFQLITGDPEEMIGYWINIASKDPKYHFPIDRETLKTGQITGDGWKEFNTTEKARAWLKDQKVKKV